MNRPWQIWLTLAGCFAVALCALGYLTNKALELDRAELAARQQAALEENVRLALWRMDTAASAIVAQESARPWSDYLASLAPPGAAGGNAPRSATVASPLLINPPPEVLLHFELLRSGTVTSPQVADEQSIRRVGAPVSEQELAERNKKLANLTTAVTQANLWEMAPNPAPAPVVPLVPTEQGQVAAADAPAQQELQQRARGDNEFQARSQIVQNNSITNFERMNARLGGADTQLTPMAPIWLGDRLLLVRRFTVRGQERLQGCWLNWTLIRGQLLEQIRDLLPTADLGPALKSGEGSRLLATLPVELKIPATATLQPIGWTPTQLALLAAWIAMVTVSVALVLLMRGILALSERRAAFVSAVTHELRTPLTTFRMYTEMLLGGMVPQASRDKYLETLHTEADRLTHLVENVLAYARLEGGRGPLALEQVSVGQLLDAAQQRLTERATQANLQFNVEADSAARGAEVRTNPLAVEQILFNLVDNACKYARTEASGEIRLAANATNGHARLSVSDSGPGIPALQLGRLFQPFHKSAHEAADTAAGVGLGLALSRRLARQMGGDLHYRPADGSGACFELTLPTAS